MPNQLSEFYIGKRINIGGQGIVREAVHIPSHTHGVLKQARYGSEGDIYNEIMISSQLNHPNVLRIWGPYSDGKNVIGFMPKLQTLYDSLPSMNIRQKLEALMQIAKAIDYLHKKNLLHCDIKTSNALVTTKGVILLSDFGLVCKIGTVGRRGTKAYCAPEVLQSGLLSTASDLYSLAVMAFEILIGFGNSVYGQLKQVFERALSNDPQSRYRSAEEFINALSTALAYNKSFSKVQLVTI